MTAKHTPGPWFVWKDHILAGPPAEKTSHSVKGYRASIARIDEDCENTNSRQLAANARLIAAAPELLAALRDLVEQVECLNCQQAFSRDYTNAKSLLARIEGE